MPFQHLVSPKDNTVFTRVIGDVSTEEVVGDIRKFGESSKIPDNFHILIDLRQSVRLRSYDAAKRIVDAYAISLGKFSNKIVFLALEVAFYGASRMTATLAEMKGYDAHATKIEEEACKLLGIKSFPSEEQFLKDGFEF